MEIPEKFFYEVNCVAGNLEFRTKIKDAENAAGKYFISIKFLIRDRVNWQRSERRSSK